MERHAKMHIKQRIAYINTDSGKNSFHESNVYLTIFIVNQMSWTICQDIIKKRLTRLFQFHQF